MGPSSGESPNPDRDHDSGTRIPTALRRLDAAVGRVSRLAAGLGAVIALAILGIVIYAVVMRYLFAAPQVWTDEMASFLMVLMVMLGVAETLRRGEHIGVDLLTGRLGPRGRRLVEIWSMAAVLVVSGVLFASALGMTRFSRLVGIVSEGHMEVPMWIPQSSILIGMALLIIAAANRLLRLLTAPDDPAGS